MHKIDVLLDLIDEMSKGTINFSSSLSYNCAAKRV